MNHTPAPARPGRFRPRRRRWRRLVSGSVAALLLHGAPFNGASGADGPMRPPVRLVAADAAKATVVFRSTSERCDALHIPDSPARAVRTPDGGVALIAAHYTNVFLLGPDFDSLAPACATGSRGAERSDPAAFDDRFWVQGLAPLPDGRVLGVASHEYLGQRHPGRCGAMPSDGSPTGCWHSSIVGAIAEPGSWRFRLAPREERVIAASPEGYDASRARRSGFFSTTNVVFDGDHAYMLVYVEGVPGQPDGMCLMRAPRADLVNGWRAFAGGAFAVDLRAGRGRDQTRPTPRCEVVGAAVFRGVVRSLVRLEADRLWAATFDGLARDAESGEAREGVFAAFSTDLVRWSGPWLLSDATPFRRQPERGLYYIYPSLIDHASSSAAFDTVGGALHLYLTRLNLAEDRRRGMDRDLVRVPVAIVR